MSAPASRPVHPCVMSLFQRGSRGAEFSTWAYLTTPRSDEQQSLPNLVTAAGSTLHIYSVVPLPSTKTKEQQQQQQSESNIRLRLEYTYPNLAGTVTFLDTLPSYQDNSNDHFADEEDSRDALLIGFAGNPRLVVATLHNINNNNNNNSNGSTLNSDTMLNPISADEPTVLNNDNRGHQQHLLLTALCLLDFTSIWEDSSAGATFAEDAIFASLSDPRQARSKNRVVAAVLGGGSALVVTEIVAKPGLRRRSTRKNYSWFAQEPYLVPLHSLSFQLPHLKSSTNSETETQQQQQQTFPQTEGPSSSSALASTHNSNTIFTNWGQILACSFVSGYSTAETLVLLHSAPGGVTWTGRMARENTSGPPPLYLTALAIHVPHRRTALLWSLPMPHDAQTILPQQQSSSYHTAGGRPAILFVLGVNTITTVLGDGRIQQILAVNGWARATCPAVLANRLKANPGIKLALQLDGCACCFLNSHAAMIVLRRGQVYLLQQIGHEWTMLPTGQTLASTGEVTHLLSYPLDSKQNNVFSSLLQRLDKTKTEEDHRKFDSAHLSTGLVFAGSRLGDSHLLGYVLDKVKIPSSAFVLNEPLAASDSANPKEKDTNELPQEEKDDLSEPSLIQQRRNQILAEEEEALYAPPVRVPSSESGRTSPHWIHASSDDDDDDGAPGQQQEGEDLFAISPDHKRQRREWNCSALQSLVSLDRLVNLGPIGPACEGPLAAPPTFLSTVDVPQDPELMLPNNRKEDLFGASAFIFPCGFGSSGSLALVTVPGRDDRMILSEVDCLNVQCVYSLPCSKLIVLGMSSSSTTSSKSGSIKLLRQKDAVAQDEGAVQWEELEEWTDPRDETMSAIARSSKLLNACEMGRDGTFAMFLQNTATSTTTTTTHVDDLSLRIAILQWNEKMIRCDFLDEFFIASEIPTDHLISSTPFLTYKSGNEDRYGVACMFASGRGLIVLFSRTGVRCTVDVPSSTGEEDMDIEGNIVKQEEEEKLKMEMNEEDDDEMREIRDFYKSQDVVALDLFRAPRHLLLLPESTEILEEEDGGPLSQKQENREISGGSGRPSLIHPDFDEEDMYMYGLNQTTSAPTFSNRESSRQPRSWQNSKSFSDDSTFLAVFRQSGCFELFEVADSDGRLSRCWAGNGVERGLACIVPSHTTPSPLPLPRSSMVKIEEARFFMCGSSLPSSQNNTDSAGFRSLCLAVTTSRGDFFLYTVKRNDFHRHTLVLEREQLFSVACKRTQEQSRHKIKLSKKGIIPKQDVAFSQYSYFRFFRFSNISGQEGLFAALSQPKWIVSERGKPTFLCHRTRHAAPAGSKPIPITGFCSPLPSGGFLMLHERVGRFGTQRLTMFRGISPVFDGKQGLLPGGGLCVERIAMGVTVRQIQFIFDSTISSGSHPLYAVLVSRELEVDQSHLNDDGMTPEEREQAEREKEEARIQRQVEADLGGFDIEQEWVEEIVRDDVFQVETRLGGASPIQKEFYSLWIVDAADEWRVVDSYDLEEFEHGLTLQVISLTEFQEEPGSAPTNVDLDDITNVTVIALGTGTLNHNGEDVSSRGRVLLFEVKKVDPGRRLGSQVANLSLMYEKDIFHGPVTSLSCLTAEGRNRLVIGAGADVNVEQWGNGKLTQVGFFRATMQILNIMLFKNFFLLSDAYDSLYFLVWRESDKSLTLLAKDYDPIAVYAAGIMSRGAAITFLCHDDRQNLQFFQYAPGEAAARGGNKLVCRADFHLGSQTTGFRQHYCRSSLLVHSATPSSTAAALKQQDAYHGRADDDQRLGVYFGTTDGRLHSIVPLSEPVYWRLAALQSVLANALESDCALSPRAWRLYRRSPRRGGCRSNDRKKGVIDGDLILRFADLPLTDQEDLASAIGSTVELILDNLVELECSSLML